MGFLSDIAAVGSLGVGLYSLFSGDDETEGERLARQAAEERKQIMDALNPHSAEGKALIDQEESKLRSDFAEQVRQLIASNNRSMARGKAGVFLNPERRDETVSRMMIRNNDESRGRAQQNVRQSLLDRLNANGAAISGYSQMGQVQGARQAADKQRFTSGLEAIFKGVGAFDKFFEPPTPTQYTFGPTNASLPWLKNNNPQVYTARNP